MKRLGVAFLSATTACRLCLPSGADFPPPDPVRIAEIAAYLPEKPMVCTPPGDKKYSCGTAEECVAKAEAISSLPVEPFPHEIYSEFYRSGEQQRFREWRNDAVGRFEVLCDAERFERRGRFVPAIAIRMEAFAAWPSWTHPKFDRALSAPGEKTIVVELLSSDLGCRLSERIQEFGPVIPSNIVSRVRAEIERRVFAPYLATADETSRDSGWHHGNWWFDALNNWNAVCHSCCVRAALAGIEDRTTRARFVEAAERALDAYLSGFSPDGYCSEGIGYWNYGFGHCLSMGLAVRKATNGRVDFFARSRARMAARYAFAYQLQKGKSPQYSDGGGHPRPHVVEWACEVWPELEREKDGDLPTRDVFPDGQVWIFRMSCGGCPYSLSIKGGSNGELHNHNDVGSWMLMLDGVAMAGDPGGEIYTRRTFSKQRYESDVLNSFGHPVPRVGGRLQGTGRKYAAKTVSSEFTDERDSVTIDLAGAYDSSPSTVLLRTVVRES